MDTDVYFHKTVTFRTGKQTLRFRTSQELFSSHDINTGTRFLLRTIIEAGYRPQRILDLGCGYGPLGITLKKLYPDSSVRMVDRDALAVVYSRQNAALNGLEDLEIYGSLGYDNVKRSDFDLIAANIPGKAGDRVIEYLLQEARYHLAPGGVVAIVVVAALEKTVANTLEDTPGTEIISRRNRSGHAVFHYRFSEPNLPKPEGSALERGIYRREDIKMRLVDLEYEIETAYGLPEFDSLSYGSQMLVKALRKMRANNVASAMVLNPGPGHIAVALWQLVRPGNIILVDRDLLALRYSRSNLFRNGCPPERVNLFHQVGMSLKSEEKSGLITGVLREEGKEATRLTVRQAGEKLSPGGRIIVAAGSTAITRLADDLASEGRLRLKNRGRWRGYGLVELERGDLPDRA
jgi:16S rRNA (guanine1207-N2)-methyltransferase